MNYLIDDISEIIDNLHRFLEYKSVQRKNGTGLIIFILGLFSFSLFFVNSFSNTADIWSLLVFFLFMFSSVIFLKLTFLPFMENISASLLGKKDRKGSQRLIYYAFLPFLFIYPICYLFYSIEMKLALLLILVLSFLYMLIRIIAFCYDTDVLGMLFFAAVCLLIFSAVFVIPLVFFGAVLIS